MDREQVLQEKKAGSWVLVPVLLCLCGLSSVVQAGMFTSSSPSLKAVIQLDHPIEDNGSDDELKFIAEHYSGVSDRLANLSPEQRQRLKELDPDIVLLRYLNIGDLHDMKLIRAARRGIRQGVLPPSLLQSILYDSSGKPVPAIRSRNGTGVTPDPASPAWRSKLLFAARTAVKDGYDGILADVCLMTADLPKNFLGIDPRTSEIYSSNDFRKAQYETLQAIQEVIRAINPEALLIANSVGNGIAWFRAEATHLLPPSSFLDVVDGVSAEGFRGGYTMMPPETRGEKFWEANVAMLETIAAKKKTCIALLKYSIDGYCDVFRRVRQHENLYQLVTVLMGKGPDTYIGCMVLDPEDIKNSFSPYPLVWNIDIGEPEGTRYRQGKIWFRDYSEGLVVMNPTDTAGVARLEEPYTLPGQGMVDEVPLPPRTGLVLFSEDNHQ